MQPFIIFLILIVAVFMVYFGGLGEKPKELSVSQVGTAQISQSITTQNTKTQNKEPSIFVDTYITSGPENGEVIDRTNRVIFQFEGVSSPKVQDKISFETKVEGLDKDWQETYSNQRTIDFPPGVKQYTFLVRAKIRNFTDSTPAKRKFQVNLSSYFGKIKISNVSKDSISLITYLGDGEKINITGWKIKGGGGDFIIPQGIEIYPGISAPNEDIFIKKYDQIYIQSSPGPFKFNKAFRPNKCFGYLRNFYDPTFPFSYSRICPPINREEICYFSQNCQNVILQLQSCMPPGYSQTFPIIYDSTCQSYIDNYISKYLNYEGCVQNYSKDENFLERSWYIYAGFSPACKCLKDTIYLYDKDGLLIDKYDYVFL